MWRGWSKRSECFQLECSHEFIRTEIPYEELFGSDKKLFLRVSK